MNLPIYAYGHPKLRQKCENIPANFPGLKSIISSMWKTMYAANGAGLAAPQIGKSLRLFIVDTIQVYRYSNFREREMFIGDKGIKQAFINPVIIETAGNSWIETEGCLSVPKLQLDIERKMSVIIKYFTEEFEEKEMLFSGATARAVLHEYDHLEGILFTDYIDKNLYKTALEKIERGDVKVDYKMKFCR